MFICNIKFNKKNIWKTVAIIVAILTLILIVFAILRLYFTAKNIDSNQISSSNEIVLDSENYTEFLRDCHNNIDGYLDRKIKGVGYVYRMPDFNDSQFVLSRTMILNSTNQGVVVGILCESDEAKEYESGEWVLIEGTISKGNYRGEMPIIKVTSIEKATAPENEFVKQPTEF